MNQTQIVTAARSLIGTPYHKYQSTPSVGIDCIGVLIAVANILSIPNCNFLDSGLTDEKIYQRVKDTCLFTESLQIGCLLAFRYRKKTTHCGILVSPNTFVHILDYKNVTEEELSDRWKSRIEAIYLFPGIIYD